MQNKGKSQSHNEHIKVMEVLLGKNEELALVDFIVLEVKDDEFHKREWKLHLGRSFMATAGMEVNVILRHLSFSCGGNRVEFDVDRPKERLFEGCFVLVSAEEMKEE
ncbi:hypothetical protein Dsin_028829 [Dipteronia sinensis]|uniref:Uncharacterized protein n=1 Tax=Dipteronia sinensis TaxID=43782 RepID=A0AAD9ZR60_9ROSI|nr:hypothetical protein Dsin_028829 [Dipteronia sinensis]